MCSTLIAISMPFQPQAVRPTGMGVLYGKTELLEAMPPYQGGGDLCFRTFDKDDLQPAAYKFEAARRTSGDTIGLGAAIEYVNDLGLKTSNNMA